MTWLLVPALLLVFAPGLLFCGVVLRRAGWVGAAVAPAISLTLWSLSGLLLDLAQLRGSRIAMVMAATGILVIVLAVSAWLGGPPYRRLPAFPRISWTVEAWPAAGFVVAVALLARTFGAAGSWVNALPQSYDYLWHQYVVTTAVARGRFGPYSLVPVDGYAEATTFYQHAVHLVAALVPAEHFATSPPGMNLTLFTAVAIVLPLGVIALVKSYEPGATYGVLVAALSAASVASASFGLLFMWPFTVAVALFPGVLAACRQAWSTRAPGWIVVAAMGTAGLFLSHPHSLLALAVVLGLGLMVRLLAASPLTLRRLPHLAAPLAAIAGGAALIASPWLARAWDTGGRIAQGDVLRPVVFDFETILAALALGRHLSTESVGNDVALFGIATMASIVYLTVRRRHPDVVLMAAVFAGFTLIAGAGSPLLRKVFAAAWLGDWYRPRAFLAVVSILVIGLATERALQALAPGRGRTLRHLAGVALVSVFLVASQLQLPMNREHLLATYGPWYGEAVEGSEEVEDTEWVMTPAQVQALQVLADATPPGTRAMNWWPDGSPWMYSVGRTVGVQTYHRLRGDDAGEFLHLHLQRYDEDPMVRKHMVELRVCTAFAGRGQVGGADRPQWQLEDDLAGFDVIYENDEARVYAVTDPELVQGCWGVGPPSHRGISG